jgi:hypothetical protein
MCRKQANVAPSAARSGRKESVKAKEPFSQAAEDVPAEDVPAADSLGSPPVPTSNEEQERQRKEEKRRRKEGRRRRREEQRMQELEGALKGTPAAEKRDAPPGTVRQTETDGPEQERERKEAKRRRKEEKRRREAAAAGGTKVAAFITEVEKSRKEEKRETVGGVPGHSPSVPTNGAAREEERRTAKEEKRRVKEERRRAREAQASPTPLPPVAPEIARAALSKRARDETGVREQDQKWAKGETLGLVSKRPRDGEAELERGTGKRPQQGEGQPNGVPKIVLDENARRREEKLRRKEERRRVREERAATGQPLGAPADAGPETGGKHELSKRPREEGGALDGSQASEKKQRSGGGEGKRKRERAEVDGPEEGGRKKQRKDGGAASVPVEVNGVVRGEGGEERRKRKEERKRGREAAAVSSPIAAANGGAIGDGGGIVEDDAKERKRARKEERRKQPLGSEGPASVEQSLGLSTPDKARHKGKRKAGENGSGSGDATITEFKEEVALVSSKSTKKRKKTGLNGP